jgi:hypothetical protein
LAQLGHRQILLWQAFTYEQPLFIANNPNPANIPKTFSKNEKDDYVDQTFTGH